MFFDMSTQEDLWVNMRPRAWFTRGAPERYTFLVIRHAPELRPFLMQLQAIRRDTTACLADQATFEGSMPRPISGDLALEYRGTRVTDVKRETMDD